MDIIFEVILLLYPIRSIFRLHTSISKKATVIMVLSCRGLYDSHYAVIQLLTCLVE